MQQQSDKVNQEREILRKYRKLCQVTAPNIRGEEAKSLKRALRFVLEAIQTLPYEQGYAMVLHGLETATIIVKKFGLGTPSIICTLLHEAVEVVGISIQEIEQSFGKEVAYLVERMLSIERIPRLDASTYAEKLKRLNVALAEDGRILLIKLASCLHDMCIITSLPREVQHTIAQQVKHVYILLAHQLGLYPIKTELEDLYLKFINPTDYYTIHEKISFDKKVQEQFFQRFKAPIEKALKEHGLIFALKYRFKGTFSIWNKMKTQEIPFEKVYDLFGIRIILDVPLEKEKLVCGQVYTLVLDLYTPDPNRTRNWIEKPRDNGYESLHTTVMSNEGRWVEVQIRTKRMDEIAEKGHAAHWRYKGGSANSETKEDAWLMRFRNLLEEKGAQSLDHCVAEGLKYNFNTA